MKIRYLNGNRLYYAFLAGRNAVVKDQAYLNKINVFPVPDADTGTNLAATLRSIAEGMSAHVSFQQTLRSMADTALLGARGNSGIIFAQFLQGISTAVKNEVRISPRAFGEAVKEAIPHAYKSMASPVEGTMLTVMNDWADAVYSQRERFSDFTELFSYSLHAAKESLKRTPQKLKVLARAGVVDAGARGFVDFLEGIYQFMKIGRLRGMEQPGTPVPVTDFPVHVHKRVPRERYCTETLLTGEDLDLDRIRNGMLPFGSSVIVAGSESKARIHVHSNRPAEVFHHLLQLGTLTQAKVDDMYRQYEAVHARRYPTALLTDSACDLPADILDKYQIHLIPFHIHFGPNLFLDKLAILPDVFYSLLDTERQHPKTSQPSYQAVENAYAFLTEHYENVIAIHVSQGLTGVFGSSEKAAANFPDKHIHVLNSLHISASQGLIVLRAAEAVAAGNTFQDISAALPEWVSRTRILVDVFTMKYFVRGGRVSPLKGLLAKALHIKPIITVDAEGKSTGAGKSFSRRGSFKQIIRKISSDVEKNGLWKYAIVHALNPEKANAYAQELRKVLGQDPEFIMEVSPVIGAHSGIGTVAVGWMSK
jgi:DegV family protein with EDD domain